MASSQQQQKPLDTDLWPPGAGGWLRLCSLALGLLLAVITPGPHLSFPSFPMTCSENNYSIRMRVDTSILQLHLQLLAKFSHEFFVVLMCPYLFKVPSDYCPIISAGEREGTE